MQELEPHVETIGLFLVSLSNSADFRDQFLFVAGVSSHEEKLGW